MQEVDISSLKNGVRGEIIALLREQSAALRAERSRKIQEKIYPFLLGLLTPVFYGLVAVSKGNADALRSKAHIPSRKLHIIHNPIVRPEMDQLSLIPLQHPWFQPGQPPVILAAGRLVAQKDYPTLLRSFSLVRQHRSAHLVILGEGTQREAILRLAEELGLSSDLDLIGFDLNPFRFMARCAVFVLSSAWEGFGNVLGEALACGAQIVSADCPSGPAEILENGKHGRLVPVGDSIAFARAIEDALDHPLPLEGLKERAKAFTSEKAVRAYLKVLGLTSNDH